MARTIRWELRFWLAGQFLMLLLAPLVGHAAFVLFPHSTIIAMYFMMAAIMWPIGPMLYTLVFRPHVI